MVELVRSPVIPAPVLPARKIHKHPFLHRVGYAIGYALGGMAMMNVIIWLAVPAMTPAMLTMLYMVNALGFITVFGYMFWMDLSTPGVTLEEMWYRKRLNEARHADSRIAQLNADAALLSQAADSLWITLGADGFKRIKDQDILDHAIEMARQKTVD